jgi:transposase
MAAPLTALVEWLMATKLPGASAAASGILPSYHGTIVRDGYAGYHHLADAVHAWCGAHGLRDLRDLYTFDPAGQLWARSMADVLIWANKQATAARAAGQQRLDEDTWARSAPGTGARSPKESATTKAGAPR